MSDLEFMHIYFLLSWQSDVTLQRFGRNELWEELLSRFILHEMTKLNEHCYDCKRSFIQAKKANQIN